MTTTDTATQRTLDQFQLCGQCSRLGKGDGLKFLSNVFHVKIDSVVRHVLEEGYLLRRFPSAAHLSTIDCRAVNSMAGALIDAASVASTHMWSNPTAFALKTGCSWYFWGKATSPEKSERVKKSLNGAITGMHMPALMPASSALE